MTIDRIGVYEPSGFPYPPERLQHAIAEHVGNDTSVTVVRSEEGLETCDGVLTVVHHEAFLDTVDWVHTIRSGLDVFPIDAYQDAGVILTNSTGIVGDFVGETVLGYMLMLSRGLHRYRDRQRDHEWGRLSWERPFTLDGTSVCVVGIGELGGSVVTRAGLMGMDVIGVDIRPISGIRLEKVYDINDLSEAISTARFVVLTLPLIPETDGLVGQAEFESMRDDAFLINVGRGGLVVEDELTTALQNEAIAGAALDVFEEEPLSSESVLWDLEEVIVTPHAASQTNFTFEIIGDVVATNVDRFENGLRLWNQVT